MSHHGNVGSLVEKKERLEPPKYTVDREATCPMLLRVFCSTSRHNSMSEYMKDITNSELNRRDEDTDLLCNTPTNELQIYTWLDATLKELEGLVKEVNPEARRRGTYFDFALVYPDLRQGPRCQTRDIGTTVASNRGPDDGKTLHDVKFVIGDYIDVAITPPTGRMDRMDYGRRRPMDFGGDRRNGFGDRDRGFGDRDRGFGDRGGYRGGPPGPPGPGRGPRSRSRERMERREPRGDPRDPRERERF